ncbi:hypothetical protein [Terribacillus aidingensis]|uniref:hypothetical protein n=1 Tax=Terribacillus aidingensis TaxID=586416 RepID=UPI000BE32642|nr:hypothetical protein [Terribacillus aidingensis]
MIKNHLGQFTYVAIWGIFFTCSLLVVGNIAGGFELPLLLIIKLGFLFIMLMVAIPDLLQKEKIDGHAKRYTEGQHT